jgi:hypothetical protein
MPTPIVKGTSGIIEKPYEVSFDPRRGIQVRRRYTQAGGASGLEPVELQARAQGYTTRKLVSPVLSELEIISPEMPTDGTGGSVEDVVYDTWQIVGNEVQESAYYSPAAMSQISLNDRTIIARAMRAGTDRMGNLSDLAAARLAQQKEDKVLYTAVTDADALQFYRQLLRGQEHYSVSNYVLRHTTNVSENSTYNVSDENVNRLLTPAQLLAEITSASLWVKPCPARLVTKLLSIEEPARPEDDELDYWLWSWRKLPSTETTGANNRVDINTDYVLYHWSTLYYRLAT